MIQLNADDIIRGLKRLKSLAKQDILVSNHVSEPELWLEIATARKEKYETLIALVEKHGVEEAYKIAHDNYTVISQSGLESIRHIPQVKGEKQALEIFFKTLGLNESVIQNAEGNQIKVGGA